MRAVVVALALLMLGACGKKSSPDAPGPQGEVSFPRMYPSR